MLNNMRWIPMELETTLKLSDIVKSPNLCDDLSETDLACIGNCVWDEWQIDKTSRSEWEEKTAESMKLALQVMEEKTFPWQNASNVKFPIVTLAALQYQARAYPSLIPSTSVVKARVIGSDPQGLKAQRADRVSGYMSYQVLEEDECWEENMDKVFISQAIVGCAFKKSYFDTALGHNVSEHILAKDLYIPYFAKSLEKASRITQVLYFSQNDLIQKYRMGLFCEYDDDYKPTTPEVGPIEDAEQEAQGVVAPSNDMAAPYELLEQHRYLDLDGDDYAEPYIVTICKDTKQILRIVARFTSPHVKKNKDKEIICIEADNYYTKFPFIPSPDGGIYDLGFGVLLGPLNQSINTILNQLVDAGTLSNTAGGFLGRGVKFRSGDNSFKPFEWKRVDSTGDDIQKGVFPLPVREPSNVLFQLLSLLIDYGNRIGMATDPMVGENPGQNTPAETSRSMINQGSKVFNSVFKRTYRALKEEFRKLYRLNSIYLNDSSSFYSLTTGQSSTVLRVDFAGDGKDVVPAADPDMITDEQKLQQAMALKAAASANPQMYNMFLVEQTFLAALKIPNAETMLVDPKTLPPPKPDPKIVVESMKLQQRDMQFKMDTQIKMFELMQEVNINQAKIKELETQAVLNLATAQGVDKGHQIAAIEATIGLLKIKNDGLVKALGILKDVSGIGLEKTVKEVMNDHSERMDGMAQQPDNTGMVPVSQQAQGGNQGGMGM